MDPNGIVPLQANPDGIGHTCRAVDHEPLWPGRLDDPVWPVWRFDLRDFASLFK